MSYDLNFWRYLDETAARTAVEHSRIYQELCEGGNRTELPELSPLDTEAIADRINAALSMSWNHVAPGFWEAKNYDAVIEVSLTPLSVRFDLRGKWSAEDANLLIDTMQEFGTPLYDPQVGEHGSRYEVQP